MSQDTTCSVLDKGCSPPLNRCYSVTVSRSPQLAGIVRLPNAAQNPSHASGCHNAHHGMWHSIRDYAVWRGYHDARPDEVSGQFLALGLLEWPDAALLEALQRQAQGRLASRFSMEDTRRCALPWVLGVDDSRHVTLCHQLANLGNLQQRYAMDWVQLMPASPQDVRDLSAARPWLDSQVLLKLLVCLWAHFVHVLASLRLR